MGREVIEISRSTGLAHARWRENILELCGQRQCIDDAIQLLDNHNEYFIVFEEMDRQEDEIQRSFEALDAAAEAAGLGSSQRLRKNGVGEKQPPQQKKKSPGSTGARNGTAKGVAT